MVDDPIRAYIDALRAYEEERKKAAKMLKSIEDISEKIRFKFPDFVALTYNLAMPTIPGMHLHRSVDPGARIDMANWPDSETIRATIANWHATFLKVRQAWSLVPTNDQKGLKEPPKTLHPSSY